ncbi:MAG: outer membrane protein transport protein [Sideroxydans sp.]|jgi:long-chain fatty acid transport protein
MKMNKILAALCVAGLATPQFANATNGMLMEGYGPIATGMGGASMAYDNGNAGMANNPATLGLMADGSRLDIALGGLHPSITSKMTGMPNAESGGTAYYMPAVGWTSKKGGMAYGIGMFAQGGMGTEYKSTDWVGAGSGLASRSEVAVGNVIIPMAYDVSSELTIGGTLDVVWSSMDLKMAMAASQMSSMYGAGLITASGGAAATLPTFLGGTNNAGYFNFSDNSSFTGSAKSTGYAGKLGVTYKLGKQLTLGATYHAKTAVGDMTSNSGQMMLVDNANALGGGAGTTYTLNGKITVVNFQFPETYGFGAAYQATDDLMVVADWKRIGWKSAMKNFRMKFSSTDMGGLAMDMTMPQNWKDQDVIQLGAAYKLSQALTVRAGANLASNPVPNDTVNPLFPATVANHITMGAGYAIDNASSINGSFVYAPKVTVTAPAASGGYTIDHGQMNWQLMYSRSL